MKSVYKLRENDVECNIVTIHEIHLKDGNKEGGWYHQIRILEGIRHRSLSRWCEFWHWHTKRYDKWHSYPRFTYYDEVEDRINREFFEDLGKPLKPLKVIVHDSAYDFCRFINYNYKDRSMKNLDTLILREPKE